MSEALVSRRGGGGGDDYGVFANPGATGWPHAANDHSYAFSQDGSSTSKEIAAGKTATYAVGLPYGTSSVLPVTSPVNWAALQFGYGTDYGGSFDSLIVCLIPEKPLSLTVGPFSIELLLTATYSTDGWYVSMTIKNNGTRSYNLRLSRARTGVISIGDVSNYQI